jgi:hypothetical protein
MRPRCGSTNRDPAPGRCRACRPASRDTNRAPEARIALGFVEAHPREQPARLLDASLGRALALIGNDLDLVIGLAKGALERHVEHAVMRLAVVRQPNLCAVGRVALLSQPCEVSGDRLALLLVMIDPANLGADVLSRPEHEIVGLRAGPAEIGNRRMMRFGSSPTKPYASLGSRSRQMLGEIGALGDGDIAAFPNVIVAVGIVAQAVQPLLLKLGMETTGCRSNWP